MNVYLVTYDLNSPGQNYNDVVSEIKKCPGWAKLSESSFAVSTPDSASDLLNKVRRVADSNDTIYVISLRNPHSGFGPPKVNDWLKENLT